MCRRSKKSSNRWLSVAPVVGVVLALRPEVALAAGPPAMGDTPALVRQIKVLPDKAPDCSSLKSIAETVTRGCKTNDAKAIAIYNFMLLSHYHFFAATEDGGIPALKEINVYGWGLCGGTHAIESALWRQLGWGWRFVLWPGHTTVEARYDGRLHYFDAFLKWYVWMPDGKGGWTVAGEEDILHNRKQLWDDAFFFDPLRKVGYMKSDQFVMVDGKANWRARDFMACDAFWMMAKDASGKYKGAVPRELNKVGPATDWENYKHADGGYRTDVNLVRRLCPDQYLGRAAGRLVFSGLEDAARALLRQLCRHPQQPGAGAGAGALHRLEAETQLRQRAADLYGGLLHRGLPEVVPGDRERQAGRQGPGAGRSGQAGARGGTALLALRHDEGQRRGRPARTRSRSPSTAARPSRRSTSEDFDDAVKGKLAAEVKVTFRQPLEGPETGSDRAEQSRRAAVPVAGQEYGDRLGGRPQGPGR